MQPKVDLNVEVLSGWAASLERLKTTVAHDDLVLVISSRRGSVSWRPIMENIPARVAALGIESFVIIFPSEVSVVDTTASAVPIGRRPRDRNGDPGTEG